MATLAADATVFGWYLSLLEHQPSLFVERGNKAVHDRTNGEIGFGLQTQTLAIKHRGLIDGLQV
jgi:hypothetical protein